MTHKKNRELAQLTNTCGVFSSWSGQPRMDMTIAVPMNIYSGMPKPLPITQGNFKNTGYYSDSFSIKIEPLGSKKAPD
jgi:hypothetical protein